MNVICFGDSNTYGYDPRSYLGGRYDTDKPMGGHPGGQDWLDSLQHGRERPGDSHVSPWLSC